MDSDDFGPERERIESECRGSVPVIDLDGNRSRRRRTADYVTMSRSMAVGNVLVDPTMELVALGASSSRRVECD
jgi:hypothetical protein